MDAKATVEDIHAALCAALELLPRVVLLHRADKSLDGAIAALKGARDTAAEFIAATEEGGE